MSFESLSYRYTFEIEGVPDRWTPLIHLYDPDLPLFPIYYFHAVPEKEKTRRPESRNRVYGYVESVFHETGDILQVRVVTNKDLNDNRNTRFRDAAEEEVRQRIGARDAVTVDEIRNAFTSLSSKTEKVIEEIWDRVIKNPYGNRLPFGRLWDEVLGLARFVASWNSPSGRKGELIQTHYFASRFGEKIQISSNLPQVDFYLLPTVQEIFDDSDPLGDFEKFGNLVTFVRKFTSRYCSPLDVDGLKLTRFNKPVNGKFDSSIIKSLFEALRLPRAEHRAAMECFNAFDKGPQRTLIYIMLLNDLRFGKLDPASISSKQMGSIYTGMKGTYHSPKAIAIYSQQCFANKEAMPVDTWIQTFMKWPLSVYPAKRGEHIDYIFSAGKNLGELERLLWYTSQARKVHSSACDDALWCMKYNSESSPRGPNPLSCNICYRSIRDVCPAYEKIKKNKVSFNSPEFGCDFTVFTSEGNNDSHGQSFVSCKGNSVYGNILDDFSVADQPDGFYSYPAAKHSGEPITVEDFVNIY